MPFSFGRFFRSSKNRKTSKDNHASVAASHATPTFVMVTAPSASSSCVDLPTTFDARQRRRPHTLTITRSQPDLTQALQNPPPYSALSTIYSATGTVYETSSTSPEPSPHSPVMIIGREQHDVHFPPTPGCDSDADAETLSEEAEGGSASKLDLGQEAEETEDDQDEPIVQIQVQTQPQAPGLEQLSPQARPRQISFSPPQSRCATPAQEILALPVPRPDRPATTNMVPRGILKNSPSRTGMAAAAATTTIPAAPTPMSETFDFGSASSSPSAQPQRSSIQARLQQLPVGPTPTQEEIDAAQSQRKRKAMSMFQFQRKMSQRDLPQPPFPPQPPRVPGIVARHFSVPPLAPTYLGEDEVRSVGNRRWSSRRNSNRNSGGSSASSSSGVTNEALPTYRQSVQPPNAPNKRGSKRGSRTSRWNTDWNSNETQAVLTALRALN